MSARRRGTLHTACFRRTLTSSTARPLPVPSELTRPFWESAARGRLVRPLCPSCGSSFFPPQICCPRCLSEDWTWAESSGRGSIYSYTVCHRAPEPGFELPYVLAIVDLEEEWSMLSNIVGCSPETVRIGMTVTVTWQRLDGEVVLPVFEPDDGARS